MKAVIQRVKYSSVTVDGKKIGEIQNGLLVLLGVTHTAVSYTHLTLPTNSLV